MNEGSPVFRLTGLCAFLADVLHRISVPEARQDRAGEGENHTDALKRIQADAQGLGVPSGLLAAQEAMDSPISIEAPTVVGDKYHLFGSDVALGAALPSMEVHPVAVSMDSAHRL